MNSTFHDFPEDKKFWLIGCYQSIQNKKKFVNLWNHAFNSKLLHNIEIRIKLTGYLPSWLYIFLNFRCPIKTLCQGKKSYRLDDIPENILEEMTREKRSTDSIEKEPDFMEFGGKSLVKYSIVNINDLWRGKKSEATTRVKKEALLLKNCYYQKKTMNAFITCLIWNYSIKMINSKMNYPISAHIRKSAADLAYSWPSD